MPPLMAMVEMREVALQPVHHLVAQRRDLAVLLRAQPAQPGLAGMDDEGVAAGLGDGADEGDQLLIAVAVVDADARLDGDRHVAGGAHRRDAGGDGRRLGHQAGAEAAGLHPVARAADIHVDLGIAPVGADGGGAGHRLGVAAAELQRHRMLGLGEAEDALAVAMQHRPGRHHLGVQPDAARDLAQEESLMAVSPVHHGCDGQAMRVGGRDHGRTLSRRAPGPKPRRVLWLPTDRPAAHRRRAGVIGRRRAALAALLRRALTLRLMTAMAMRTLALTLGPLPLAVRTLALMALRALALALRPAAMLARAPGRRRPAGTERWSGRRAPPPPAPAGGSASRCRAGTPAPRRRRTRSRCRRRRRARCGRCGGHSSPARSAARS